ncbi:TPA_asm: site-specific integrase, partial [Listeria monocytogenes]|nr:site-specific integrase [Listeria monocytogenes]
MAKKKKEILFCDYYDDWVETYKVDAIADVTLKKYYQVAKVLREICPKLFISDFDRREYQRIINEYAKTHEKQTTIDFHHHVKSCIKDLFHDRLIDIDPTYKAVLKGSEPTRAKKKKFLQIDELKKLISLLDLSEIGIDWLVMIVAKTGIRYAEALA